MQRMATRIKHCGITSLDDAHRAAEAGAWALGMIFWDGSPRRCRLGEAQAIGAALRRTVQLVGVFVNAPLEEIDATVQAAGLTMVQLHGDEGPIFCREVARRTGAKVIKASRVRSKATLQAAAAFHPDFHLLDAHVEGVPGGTGQTLDWELVRRHRLSRPTPLYLAERLSEVCGRELWLKREDLNHTGSHKINNALGQALLAKRMGKKRVIAETGAGQHGVATATACALLGLECHVYMGSED